PLADAQQLLQHLARLACRLQGLAEHDDIEGVVWKRLEVAVGVALDYRQAVPHAGIDAGLAQLDAARVDRLRARQIGKQRAVAAATIKDARARLDHSGDQPKVAPQLAGRRPGGNGRRYPPAQRDRGAAVRHLSPRSAAARDARRSRSESRATSRTILARAAET